MCVGVGLFVRQCLLLFVRCHLFKFNECIAAFLALANVTPETFVNRWEGGNVRGRGTGAAEGTSWEWGFILKLNFNQFRFVVLSSVSVPSGCQPFFFSFWYLGTTG